MPKIALPFFKKPKGVKEENSKKEEKKKPKRDWSLSKKTPKGTKALTRGLVTVKDIIAPPAIEVDFDYIKVGNIYFRTLYVVGYPRFVGANWLSPLINFDHTLEIALFHYPVESKDILEDLKRKIGEMEATIASEVQRGRVIDPSIQVALDDALSLQQELAKGAERFFQFGLYISIPAENLEELNTVTKQVESMLGSLLIISKHATLQTEEGFKTTLPLCQDHFMITRNMDTTSLATTFPFTSSELTANEGIMFGINEHNGSLIVFDRFTLENANSVLFAKAGAGKSYLVKLECLRSLMFGTEIIALDPEAEYQTICSAIGGEYVSFSFKSGAKINPFDLSGVYEEGENELGLKILSLHGLFKVIMGKLTPEEDAILDRALVLTYKSRGITPDPATQKREPPLMEDLYKVLIGMEEPAAKGMADRIEKFIRGSLAGIFDQKSNIDIRNTFTVFSIRDLEDELRPIAMYIILDYIWTKVKKDLRKRILVVDEAWYFMKYPDSAMFLYSIAKRARKYYLGLTTITQDIEDFLASDYGKAIVTNSSIQILMKQSPAAIDKIAETFYLSEGEKHLLLACDQGEGLFFAGPNHVAMRVVASPEEHYLVTTKPSEVLKMREQQKEKERASAESQSS
jgi:conjugal transfer ATP-binding protein TraC